MTAASTCPFQICHRCHNDAENEATKGPGMSLRGEKYLLRTKLALRMIAAAATRAWRTVVAGRESGSGNISQLLYADSTDGQANRQYDNDEEQHIATSHDVRG
jgi:hypothetical protein